MINNSLDLGVIILCPDRKEVALKITASSARYNLYNRDIISIVGNDASPHDFKNFKEYCPTYKGKNTIASLINTGFKRLEHEWGLLIFAGNRFSQFAEHKFNFARNKKDIIFPVTERNCNFLETPLDGLLVNKKTFDAIGNWPEKNDLNYSKLIWMASAQEYGCKFKAIVGLRIN